MDIDKMRNGFQKVLSDGGDTYLIYYMNFWKPRPEVETIKKLSDYTYLMTLMAGDMEEIFYYLQGEMWSPEGEARDLISELGLEHTSISVGDILYNRNNDAWFIVDHHGFTEIEMNVWK